MIHLTRSDGLPIAVNPFHIFAIEPLGEKGCRILASSVSSGGMATLAPPAPFPARGGAFCREHRLPEDHAPRW